MPDLTQPIEFSFILKSIGFLVILSLIAIFGIMKKAKKIN